MVGVNILTKNRISLVDILAKYTNYIYIYIILYFLGISQIFLK